MGAKRVSKQGVTVSEGNAIEVTNTAGTALFSVNSTGNINTLANLTAKGSILTASAANTPAALAVGNAGETLVADSSTSTGLRWTDGNPVGNPVLNSAFQIWQRGTSIATAAGYTADRWYAANNANTTYSRQTTSDTTNLPNIQYSLRMQRTAGATSTDGSNILQNFESVNSIPFAGKTVTLSFYARSGANLSGTFNAYLISGTGTDQNDFTGGGFTGKATPISATSISLTTTWQRFSYSGTVAATATQIAIQFNKSNVGTAGANDWAEVTGVQIDLGSTALPFRTYAGTIQGELAACQRYYYRNANGGVYNYYGMGTGFSTTSAMFVINFQTQMRTTPTAVDYANLRIDDTVTSTSTFTGLSIVYGSPNTCLLQATGGTGLTQYRPYGLANNNSTAGYLGFSAEL